MALRGTGRSLGFSIEGSARARSADGRTITKGVVRHCAITHVAVNKGSDMHAFLKSLSAMEEIDQPTLEKAWRTFAQDLLDGPRKKQGGLTKAQATNEVTRMYPGLSRDTASRVVAVIWRM